MKETIQRDTPVDLFNNILKTARNAGALQELDRIIDTSTPGSMVIWMSPGIRNGSISARSRRWNAILPR